MTLLSIGSTTLRAFRAHSSGLARGFLALLVAGTVVDSGCHSVSKSQFAQVQSQNRTLAEQSRAQLAEIENVKIHARRVEDQLIHAEEELARLDQRGSGNHLAGSGMPPGLSGRLAALAESHPSLHFDPKTGISKLDTDVLFDSGDAQLKPGADEVLGEIAEIFNSEEARDLKIMVVGHADAQGIKGRELLEKYPNNWHLSAGRALSVADWLRKSGIPERRMGVAGFGQYQPVSGNDTPDARQRNRRVEIYVLGPETPVVGWTDMGGAIYR